MKWELKNWRIEELKKRCCSPFSSIPQFLNSSVLLLLLLAACGFEPLHGQPYQQSLNVNLSSVETTVSLASTTPNTTATISRRYGELFKAELEEQVNPERARGEKLFTLAVSFNEANVALLVNPDGTSSRGDLIYNTNYTLTRRLDRKIVASGTIQSTSSYNSSPTADYAAYVSIEDARKRGMIELAKVYKLRLASLLPVLNNPKASAVPYESAKPAPIFEPVYPYETRSTRY